MVITSGISDQRVNNPIASKPEQITSAKTARTSEISGPTPNGSANLMGSEPNRRSPLPKPCPMIIDKPKVSRSSNNAISVPKGHVAVLEKYFF